MKKWFTLLVLVFSSVSVMLAQSTITGTITDESGEPLIGANVVAKGTTVGTVTDFDGYFSLDIPEGVTELEFSYTGYATKDIALTGESVLDVILSEGLELGEVVVTGLGIKKEKKALGYGVATLSSELIADRGETDIARILNGKATGVQIQQTSGLAGSGTNIIIRGYSSISGDNQPLFVVDGVPFNSATNADNNFEQGSATASSRFLDLDPNNIKEMNILKGLSATVLYGEAGRNGVVLVTTKSGSGGSDAQRKLEVSVTQGVSISSVSNLPDYQNTYGNGFNGNFGWFFSNWGPAFDIRGSNGIAADGTVEHPYDQPQYNDDFPQLSGVRYPYQPYESVENFFQDGTGYNTSINVKKNFGDASFSGTYSYTDDEGFTPRRGQMVEVGENQWEYRQDDGRDARTNSYTKHNLGLGGQVNLSNGFRVSGSFNYLRSERVNPPAAFGNGSGTSAGQTSLFSDVLYTPRSINLMGLPFESPLDGSNVYYRRGSAIQNPLWTLNNITQEEQIDRFFGNFTVMKELTPWLTAQLRAGIDNYTQVNENKTNRGGPQDPLGRYVVSTRTNNIYDHTLSLLYDYNINEDWNFNGVIGLNLRGEEGNLDRQTNSNQFVRGLFTAENFIVQENESGVITTPTTRDYIGMTKEITNGVFGTFTAGFRSYLYLGIQARNDWTSTLSPDNRSVFYPSANVSFIASEAFNLTNTMVEYLKLRVGYGVSAGYPNPYVTSNVLASTPRRNLTADGTLVSTNSVDNFLGNPNLEAERHEEIEFGLEARFWQNRLGVDLSLYDKQSTDLIIQLDLDPSTGFTSTFANSAEVSNQGVELGITIDPFQGRNFGWRNTFNYTTNNNVVESIAEGVDQVLIAGFTNLGNFAIPGQTYSAIQGTTYERSANGELLVNGVGSYIENTANIDVIGDPQANYNLDWLSSMNYKNFALEWQWAYQDGGDIYSVTASTLLARGNTTDTDIDRFLPVILPGVSSVDENIVNTTQTYLGDASFDAYFGAAEGAIFDATNIRLREVALSYVVPAKLLTNTPFGRISLKVYGNNLWFKAVNFPEGVNFDPEVLSLGVGNGRGFDSLTGPTARRYGAVLNVTF